jgi:hypothetical protein
MIHNIEISKSIYEEGSFKTLYYGVNYCGKDMLKPEVDSYCSNFKIKTYYHVFDWDEPNREHTFKIEKEFPHSFEKHEHYIYTTLEKAENRMHSICKQVAKLYLEKSVPPEFRSSIKIVNKII